MSALRIIFGIFLSLLAVFTGGCSLGFAGAFLLEPGGDQEIWTMAGTGLLATPFLILFAWMSFRTPDSELDEAALAGRMSGGRFLGGVACVMIFLLMAGLLLISLAFTAELDMQAVAPSRMAVYAVVGLAAVWGAVLFFRRRPSG